MKKITLVMEVMGAILVVLIVLSIISTIVAWYWQQAFKIKREEYCDKAVSIKTDNGEDKITDPRPVYVCNF